MVARDPRVSRQFVLAQPKGNLDPPQPGLAYRIEAADNGDARIAWLGASHLGESELLAGMPSRLRTRFRVQEFLLSFLKDGPRSTRDIWKAAQEHRFSKRTLDRARVSLNIRSTRVHTGKPDQTNYWVLPDHEITPAISDTPDVDKWLRDWHERWSDNITPLDDEPRLP